MTKFVSSSFALSVLLIFSYSCQDEENISPSVDNSKIRKVTLDGVSAQDTLTLNYEGDKIAGVNWCTHVVGASTDCLVGYSELRHYNGSGKLDSIGGRWKVSYAYENGVRHKMIARKDNQYFSTTTFLEYSGSYPVKIRVEFATGELSYVELAFNSAGDVTRKKISNGQGVILEDTQVEYTSVENPLQGMMETPSYSVLFFGFDDFIFYYSRHVPEMLVTSYSESTPVYPKNVTIRYNAVLNVFDKLVSANATRTVGEQEYNVHNIFVSYE